MVRLPSSTNLTLSVLSPCLKPSTSLQQVFNKSSTSLQQVFNILLRKKKEPSFSVRILFPPFNSDSRQCLFFALLSFFLSFSFAFARANAQQDQTTFLPHKSRVIYRTLSLSHSLLHTHSHTHTHTRTKCSQNRSAVTAKCNQVVEQMFSYFAITTALGFLLH